MDDYFCRIYKTVEGQRGFKRLNELFDLVANKVLYSDPENTEEWLIWVDIEPLGQEKVSDNLKLGKCRIIYARDQKKDYSAIAGELSVIANREYENSHEMEILEYFFRKGDNEILSQVRRRYRVTINIREYCDLPFTWDGQPTSDEECAKWSIFSKSTDLLDECLKESLLQAKNLVVKRT